MKIKQILKENIFFTGSYNYLRALLTTISPTLNTRLIYRVSKGKWINLESPKTFDEKISWLKLNIYNKSSLVSQCADKYEVREYVRACGLEEILNELYDVFESEDEIEWTHLPNKFVLKWNMGCGCNIICKNKEEMDSDVVKSKLKKWGNTKYYLPNAELQYKYIQPKITLERLLEKQDGNLPDDYKLYCFNGVAKYVMVCVGREEGNPKFYFFDRSWNLVRLNKDGKEAPENFSIPKPEGLDKLFEYADILSKPFPFVRADFYLVDGKVIFGELTFTPSGGRDSNMPHDMDLKLGELISLPNTQN